MFRHFLTTANQFMRIALDNIKVDLYSLSGFMASISKYYLSTSFIMSSQEDNDEVQY